MKRYVLVTWLVLVAIAACTDGGRTTCPAPLPCDASPIGSWTQIDCLQWNTIRYFETVNGILVTDCTLAIDSEDIKTSGQIAFTSEGNVTFDTTSTGPWSGIVDPRCVEYLGACERNVFKSYGATDCYETPEGCRCDGTLDRTRQETGSWSETTSDLELQDADSFTYAYSICATDTLLRLDDRHAFKKRPASAE